MKNLIRTTRILALMALMSISGAAIQVYAMESTSESVVLAGGCFWGMESVFDHTKGVKKAVAGYAGGSADAAQYQTVSNGNTGHAESVQVTYDPQQVTLSQILDIYFKVAHNPTELNYQGPDHGTQYRSTVFYSTPAQQQTIKTKIAELEEHHVFDKPIVTTLESLKGFYPAEDYHQHYADLHPNNPYILINDAPKVERLKQQFPELYIK